MTTWSYYAETMPARSLDDIQSGYLKSTERSIGAERASSPDGA